MKDRINVRINEETEQTGVIKELLRKNKSRERERERDFEDRTYPEFTPILNMKEKRK